MMRRELRKHTAPHLHSGGGICPIQRQFDRKSDSRGELRKLARSLRPATATTEPLIAIPGSCSQSVASGV